MNKTVFTAYTAGALLVSVFLALVDQGVETWRGGLAYFVLLLLAGLLIWAASRAVGASRNASRAAWTAFFVRLGIGVLLTLFLPVWGYQDNENTLNGYVFTDAHLRDYRAWELAASDDSLLEAFSGKYPGDQYGGLMFLSAAVYRLLSPDAHRQMLILIAAAGFGALGALFLWKAGERWFGERTANWAAWIFALYPEAVLLGASQMREPFVFSAAAMAFYGVVLIQEQSLRRGLTWLGVAGLLLGLFQPPVGLAALAVLGGVWLLDPHRRRGWLAPLSLAAAGLGAAVLVYVVWARLPSLAGMSPWEVLVNWLANNFNLQAQGTVGGSGHAQEYLNTVGLLIYGAVRPVLPGALVDGIPVWRVINSLRAAGWYLLAPVLIYGAVLALRPTERRGQLLGLAGVIAAWTLIASANGGADEWDNPRYRTIFIPWMALLAAWAWNQAAERRDPWLKRFLLVEGVFVALFVIWYISRDASWSFLHLDFPVMVILCLVSAVVILGGGWVRDRQKYGRDKRDRG